MKLVIVESPKKAKTISAILGSGYEVHATVGHFRDLPERELAVDLTTFQPTYVIDEEKASLVSKLKKLAAGAEFVFLATDDDREGEAISWHLDQVLRHSRAQRIRFREITPNGIREALAHAGPIDQHRVDAQQARRVLDRLVGYQISPLLGAFGPNHSAGRVQSAALHLIVEREKARETFNPTPFWTLVATYPNDICARHVSQTPTGEWTDTNFRTEAAANAALEAARGPHTVASLATKELERRPKPPFTTTALQQAANVVLGLKPGATMAVAQSLFEAGLISYHRTDSVTLSEEAIAMAREAIARDHPNSLPDTPPRYKNKANAQAAHEAIRPTQLGSTASQALAGDEARLYDLIVRRFLASQCRPARLSQTTVLLTANNTTWRARGTVVLEPHWLQYMKVDEESQQSNGEQETDDATIPAVAVGELLEPHLDLKGSTTKPPPRYTVSTLIDELERLSIGRPATCASIVDGQEGTLFIREYLAEEKKAIFPTARGRLVDAALSSAFPDIVDAHYTSELEKVLDEIEEGRRLWIEELRRWHPPFARNLAAAPASFEKLRAEHPELLANTPEAPKPTGKPCPLCGKELFLRSGSKGAFLACSGYPQCNFSSDPSATLSQTPCPKCGKPMIESTGQYGRYARCAVRACGHHVDLAAITTERCPLCAKPLKDKGNFLSCSGYPECRYTIDKRALEEAKKQPQKCPDCGALLVRRDGKLGRPFLGCSRYPACKHITPLEPQPKAQKAAHARSTSRRSPRRAPST